MVPHLVTALNGPLLELEKKCRCEMCGSRNARVYPWWGDATEGALGLEGPPRGGR